MSTDLVLVAKAVEQSFGELVHERMSDALQQVTNVIDARSHSRINALVGDARERGAKVTTAKGEGSASTSIIEQVTIEMAFWRTESFGPMLGIRAFEGDDTAVRMVNDSPYGLSGAIFSRNHLRALKMAKKLEVGAVHVNSATVHDEASLPHGGRKESGWGRFGADWGFEEFLQTKTIILHP
jgi:acyl-CoA reductase-like NAD-dependent aldehyde dehydrogenase